MFSQKQHQLRLQRAARLFRQGNDFLIETGMQDLIERLSTVNRTFDLAIVAFARTPLAADLLQQSGKVARVARLEEPAYVGSAEHIGTPDNPGLDAQSADLIIAPLTLHWAKDLPGALIQMRRALKPNGLLLATLPGPDTLMELRQCLLEAESDISGGAAMRSDPFTDIRDAGSLLQRAGFALPVVDQETLTVRYGDAVGLINDLRCFGATHHAEGTRNPPLSKSIRERLIEVYASRFSDPDGRVRATFNIVSLSGWAPHESQQQPLKPGSAKARLADALNTDEIKI